MDRIQDPRVKPVPITTSVQGKRIRVPSREECELHAYALLATEHVKRPPVDVYALASAVGIYDVAVGEGRRAAITMKVPGVEGVAVLLRRLDSPRRQRFSLAHEIGHRLLHPDVVAHSGITPIAARGGQGALERAMNQFAGALLMPRLWMAATIAHARQRGVTDDELVDRIAQVFDVSPGAAIARLRELGHLGTGR